MKKKILIINFERVRFFLPIFTKIPLFTPLTVRIKRRIRGRTKKIL